MRFSLLLPLVLALGCAGIQTDYDYDPLVSFENMKSYRWKRSTAEQVMPAAPYQIRAVDLERKDVVETLASSRRHRGRTGSYDRDLKIPGT